MEQENSREVKKSQKPGSRGLPDDLSCGRLLTCSTALPSVRFSALTFAWGTHLAMPFMFENLEVYQRAVSFADSVAELTQQFPRGYGFLVDQLNRAALSIATNLAEGNGRFTKADRRNFFTIARGSTQECVPLLEVARRRGLVEPSRHQAFKEELEIIAKMLSGLINGLEKREV